tara:strand:+ start:1082 stop:1756 length:675 start_codon:yes stop_codon:yes gene_type:complete
MNYNFKKKYTEISKYIRNYNIYYLEFKIFIHPPAIVLTYLFSLIKITPNLVSSLTLIFSIICLYFFHINEYLLSFLFYLIRTILDYSDGALARYQHSHSKFGKYFDLLIDWMFYLSFWVLLIINHIELWFIFFVPLFYVLAVEYFIEPRIVNLIKREFLKEYFIKKGILIGFAPFGIFELWTLFLYMFFPINNTLIFILVMFVLIDLIARLYESIIYNVPQINN